MLVDHHTPPPTANSSSTSSLPLRKSQRGSHSHVDNDFEWFVMKKKPRTTPKTLQPSTSTKVHASKDAALSNPSIIQVQGTNGFNAAKYTGMPFSSPTTDDVGPVFLAKFLNHNAKKNCFDGLLMDENGERPQIVVDLQGETTTATEAEDKVWIVQRVKVVNDEEYMVKWWGSDRHNLEKRTHLLETLSPHELNDLEKRNDRNVKESHKRPMAVQTPMERVLVQLVLQRYTERNAQFEDVRSQLKKGVIEKNGLGVKGSINFEDMYSAGNAISRAHVQFVEATCYPDVLAALYPPTKLDWTERSSPPKPDDTTVWRKRVYSFWSTSAFANWHGIDMTVANHTKRGGDKQSSVVAGVAEVISGFTDAEQSWSTLIKHHLLPLHVDLSVKWGDGQHDHELSDHLKEKLKDMKRPIAMVIDDQFVHNTKFVKLIIPTERDNKKGSFHNVLGVVVYGECGWIPIVKVKFIGIPQVTHTERYTHNNIPLNSQVVIKWRVWFVCNETHICRYH